MLLKYHITQKMPCKVIVKEHQVELHTACDWFQFCREVILDFIETKSEMTGGKERSSKSTKVNSERGSTIGDIM